MNNSILDNEKDKLTNAKQEDILFQTTPNPPFVISYLSNGGHHDVMSGGSSPFVLLIMGTIIVAFFLQKIAGIIGIILSIILGIAIFIRPNIIISNRKKNTAYYILKDGVYFKFFGWGKEKSTFVPFENIKKISTIPLKTGEGDIILYLKEKANFVTYDFVRNTPLPHPTIIKIKDVKKIAKMIEENIKN